MRILCSKITGELMGLVGDDIETEETKTAKEPDGWLHSEMMKWRYDIDNDIIVLKEGQALDGALQIIAGQSIERIITKHAGSAVSPQVIGLLEAACDLMVQMLDCWVKDTPPSASEVDNWNAFVTECKPHFKTELHSLDDKEISKMREAKAAARKTETDMRADPDWPKEA